MKLPRPQGGSLALRLMALAALPLLAMTMLALGRIDQSRDAVAAADQLVDTVALHRTVAGVYRPEQLERVALDGMARLDELGVPRELVVSVSGIDLEAMDRANHLEFEAALDRLGRDHRDLELDGTTLGERLDPLRAELSRLRLAVEARTATELEVSEAFDELDELLGSALSLDESSHAQQVTGAEQAQLRALANVIRSAGNRSSSLLESLFHPGPDQLMTMVATSQEHVTYLDSFASTLVGPQRSEIARLRDGLDPLSPILLDGMITATGPLAIDSLVIGAATETLASDRDYLGELERYSNTFHSEMTALAEQRASAAESDLRQVRWMLWGIGILTFVLLTLAAWSTLVPLRRLTRRAEQISEGELTLEPLPVRGPSDVRSLTMTMNDMLVTLNRVDREIGRLASGTGPLAPPEALPGAIGVSIRDSVAHLAGVTAQLHRSEQLASAIVAQAADAIWTVDVGGEIRSANAASEVLTGLAADVQIGRSIADFLSASEGEASVTSIGGRRRSVLAARSEIIADPDELIAIIAHDISERAEFETQLSHQARHDALTGLPNRSAVLEHLAERLAAGLPTAVLFVDLDGFKNINDLRGHAAGDDVIVKVSHRLRNVVDHDGFIGRLGGDEFVIVASTSDTDEAVDLGTKVIAEIEEPSGGSVADFGLSASIGVAVADVGAEPNDLIMQADNALYQAKRNGRGRVEVFDVMLQADIEHDAELELALRHAIRDGELALHLQPIIDVASGEIDGAEALVRWERPGYGSIPPGDFIPVAERSSLIIDIERWVLQTSCERLAAWRQRDPETTMRVAINISGRHLIHGDLVADIDDAIAATGADPHLLEIELTETQLLADLDRATLSLTELRARGIRIAIDDFGTGYSSMTYLRHLPIDAIKIDQTFVARSSEDRYDSTVIEALLTIGQVLDLDIVAEGIETETQLDFVRRRGCTRAQGYLIARPAPIDDAESVMFAVATPA